jgi:predicted metal-binding protein
LSEIVFHGILKKADLIKEQSMDQDQLERLFVERGFADFKWTKPEQIVVAQWVRMKCTFGCPDYGKNATCPPNVPSVGECRQFFNEYNTGVIFHIEKQVEKPEDRKPWSAQVNQDLLKVEREVFLAGHPKAFLLAMDNCRLCTDCPGEREKCKHPRMARPAPEGMAVDVFSTVRQCGFPIEVLKDYAQTMNRYAFLLIE